LDRLKSCKGAKYLKSDVALIVIIQELRVENDDISEHPPTDQVVFFVVSQIFDTCFSDGGANQPGNFLPGIDFF
jgi:hypothetical protein